MGVKDTAEESVLQHRAGGVLTLTLNRPERRNAVDDATANVLHERVRAVHDDPDCQVIVIDGAVAASTSHPAQNDGPAPGGTSRRRPHSVLCP